MTAHSSVVGGSTAGRLLNCPGSFQATLALPPSVGVPSEYAEEGTFAHAVMAQLMERRQADESLPLITAVTGWVGDEFYDRKLTSNHLESMIVPALYALAELERFYGGGFSVAAVERSVAFPGVPGAFGTVDLILRSKTHVLHIDWKFGSGTPVAATYDTPVGELVNPQLMFYLTAARASIRNIYQQSGFHGPRSKLVVAIIQPRGDVALSHTMVTYKEIRYFREDVERAVIAALAPNPVRSKGEHCRYAPCKVACPLWTGPLLDLSVLEPVPPPVNSREPSPTAYAEYLAKAKVLLDLAAMLKQEVDAQMHSYLEAGGQIPGWRLKAKVKQRQWVDEAVVKKALKKLGFDDQDIWQKKLQTFASVDATAKRLGVKIPDDLRVAPVTNETTIATIDDPAPVVNRAAAIEQFRASLALLSEGK